MSADPENAIRPLAARLRNGTAITVRPIRPDDGDRLQSAIVSLSPESRYSRFFSPLRKLSPQLLERATHPDPVAEVQLVAVVGYGAEEKIVGGARYVASPGTGDRCEFAVAVADEWNGVGLARILLETLMQVARARGFAEMEGYVLDSNTRMLGLAGRLGFREVESPEGPTVCLLRCDLTEERTSR